MAKYYRLDDAKATLEKYKDKTVYFSNGVWGCLDVDDMRNMFMDTGFGLPETETILAALVMAGAMFTISPKTYEIEVVETRTYHIEVEADDEENAVEKARAVKITWDDPDSREIKYFTENE